MLSTAINSTSELVSIALYAEREAATRYSELAEKMHEYGNSETAMLFERMSEEEKLHAQKLIDWATQTGNEILPDIGNADWAQAGAEKIYDGEARDPAQCTPYKALAYAVHNEERAFDFYTHVAAISNDPAVCKFAEILAHEELGHAALLRTQRRREWHKERNKQEFEPAITPTNIHNVADLLTVSIFYDMSLIGLIEQATASNPELKAIEMKAREVLTENEKKLSQNGLPGTEISAELNSLNSWRDKNMSATNKDSTPLKRIHYDSDRSFTFYDAVMASTQDEATMLLAQKLCSQSLERIAELQQLACNSSDQTDT